MWSTRVAQHRLAGVRERVSILGATAASFYDPATGQFVSRDPIVGLTGEAYG